MLWNGRSYALQGASRNQLCEWKKSLPYVIACNSMSNIYHVTQVRFAASVPEGKSRTSRAQVQLHALWGNYTAAIARQQYCDQSRLTKQYTHYERPRLHPAHQGFLTPTNCPAAERYTCRRCLHTPRPRRKNSHPYKSTQKHPFSPVPVSEPKAAANTTRLSMQQARLPALTNDRLVKRILPHSIRPQLLQHDDPAVLHGRERDAALKSQKHHEIVGVVFGRGRMEKTVSVRVAGRRYEPRIGKVRSRFVWLCCGVLHLAQERQYANIAFSKSTLQTTRTTSSRPQQLPQPRRRDQPPPPESQHRCPQRRSIHHHPFGTPIESRPPIPSPKSASQHTKPNASQNCTAASSAAKQPRLSRSNRRTEEPRRRPRRGRRTGQRRALGTEKGTGKISHSCQGRADGQEGPEAA